MGTHRVETKLDETTIRALDGWRAGLTPSPSRSTAVRLLLEERLGGGQAVGLSRGRYLAADRLGALYALERLPGFGPVKFREMHDAGVDPQVAIEHPERLPFRGRTGDKLREAVRALVAADVAAGRSWAMEQLQRASDSSAAILVHGDPQYPRRVYESNNPVPILYVRGDPAIWGGTGSVAVVGSRNTRDPYASYARTFAAIAARRGMVVVSGFAVGADSIGHAAAREVGGRTVCVMPCGLDKVFPPENRRLWEELLAYEGAAFVSEFGFGQRASSLRLRKRNKLIVAFAQGVLVAQSATDGGAMNAYRFGRDQKKPVATFSADGSSDTTGNAAIVAAARTRDVNFELKPDGTAYEKWLDGLSSWT
ncbi:MAG: DNA-processing protein DprA [Acidobacteria bacterium]|nr:DNA-processing protein DprA [Acidobacteriota bacterium]